MKAYGSFFRMRVIAGLQYRAAALAGIATQFAWGGMTILMFAAFYRSDAAAFPMSFSQLSSYIWLQQAFLALYMAWFFEQDIFGSIESGSVAYSLCRPMDIYGMWFVQSISSRVYRALLRFIPVLGVAALLPEPYGLSLPAGGWAFAGFVASLALGLLVMVSINMLAYITCFYTLSSYGIRVLAVSAMEILAGAIIPVPFFPEPIQRVLNLLPFASTQNTPFLIYNGFFSGRDGLCAIALQCFWLVALVTAGKIWIHRALRRVVIQGG